MTAAINETIKSMRLPRFQPGEVWLTGAGPGDPGLLTLHAVNALSQADVILYDALVDEAVLRLARPDVVTEFSGKRGGKPSASQRDITERLIELAREGHRVLRLKGGDPFVFGRGGEEAQALREAGIRFRVVPGITAGIGGLAYAGIPATYRGIGQAIAFVTAHDLAGTLPGGLDWAALARMPTLVCYMAMGQLPAVAERLVQCGRSPDEPVAVIEKASRPGQHVVETTLARVAVDAVGIDSPAMIVVGRVVGLRAELDWFEPGAFSV